MLAGKPKILLVDDETLYIDILVDLLKDDYTTVVAKSGAQALKRVLDDPLPDLVLLDILMPGMDGYEVCRRLKEDPRSSGIPVIFLTIKSEVSDEIMGFELGAVDYIAKPMSPPIVRARVKSHLALHRAQQQLANQNEVLEQRVKERTEEISRTKDVAIFCLATLTETRDNETGKHILRTQNYIRILAEHLKDHPRFSDFLQCDGTIEMLAKTSPLHDIGKVGVPDRILQKPGKLDSEEWKLMQQHAEFGHNALLRAEQELGSTDFLQMAREIAYTHHEHWDGSGYPQGLKGEGIPVSGRLMAVADVYDALINKRVYKDAFSHEEAVAIVKESAGSHLDPDMVEAFLQLEDEFLKIATHYRDGG
ncbi:MAG: two-component system response regulator [Candidatus Thiodiazotropha sp.]